MSRIEIAENRQAIMDLVESVFKLDEKLEKLVGEIQRQISENKYFLEMYLKLDLIINEIKEMIQNAMFYLEHLQTQLNFLSLGKLTPSCLSPANLLMLLTEIKSHLPSTLSLISEPKTELWLFYQRLQTSALLFEDKIVVIIKIPLLQVNNQYEVWKVFNLPIVVRDLITPDENAPDMIATYRLESQGFIINKAKTRYSLLTQGELDLCSEPVINYCNIQNPIYPVNLAKLCIINLFLQKSELVKLYCESVVTLNTKLPFGIKLMNFLWGIVSQTELRFSIVCNNGQSVSKTTKPPIDILQVPAECIASNDFFTLTSSYTYNSDFKIKDQDLKLLRSINISQINVLQPLEEKHLNFTKIPMPKSLGSLEQIPLQGLISELESFQEIVTDDNSMPYWVYFCIGITVLSFVILCTYIYKKHGDKIRGVCCYLYESWRSKEVVETMPDQGTQGVSTDVERQMAVSAGREPTTPSQSGNDENIRLGSLYPVLFPGTFGESTRL